MSRKLEKSFFIKEDVVAIAEKLLGKCIFTCINGVVSGGIITETEAYSYREKGCHAYQMKRTARTEVMFREGGIAYVYLCYGMHYLVNVVTNVMDKPEAVLIRSIEPLEGIDIILTRRKQQKLHKNLLNGPAKVTQALGIDISFNKLSFSDHQIWMEDRGIHVPEKNIARSERIGIDYAGEDAKLPWRFIWKL
jgi:DNA-3-methyladenine glycosylase